MQTINYKPNKIKWTKDDIVIHDADEKIPLFLMIIIEDKRSDGLLKTQYINRKGFESFYLNHKDFLHDPALFNINTKPPQTKKQYSQSLEGFRD